MKKAGCWTPGVDHEIMWSDPPARRATLTRWSLTAGCVTAKVASFVAQSDDSAQLKTQDTWYILTVDSSCHVMKVNLCFGDEWLILHWHNYTLRTPLTRKLFENTSVTIKCTRIWKLVHTWRHWTVASFWSSWKHRCCAAGLKMNWHILMKSICQFYLIYTLKNKMSRMVI